MLKEQNINKRVAVVLERQGWIRSLHFIHLSHYILMLKLKHTYDKSREHVLSRGS